MQSFLLMFCTRTVRRLYTLFQKRSYPRSIAFDFTTASFHGISLSLFICSGAPAWGSPCAYKFRFPVMMWCAVVIFFPSAHLYYNESAPALAFTRSRPRRRLNVVYGTQLLTSCCWNHHTCTKFVANGPHLYFLRRYPKSDWDESDMN